MEQVLHASLVCTPFGMLSNDHALHKQNLFRDDVLYKEHKNLSFHTPEVRDTEMLFLEAWYCDLLRAAAAVVVLWRFRHADADIHLIHWVDVGNGYCDLVPSCCCHCCAVV